MKKLSPFNKWLMAHPCPRDRKGSIAWAHLATFTGVKLNVPKFALVKAISARAMLLRISEVQQIVEDARSEFRAGGTVVYVSSAAARHILKTGSAMGLKATNGQLDYDREEDMAVLATVMAKGSPLNFNTQQEDRN